MTTGAMMSSAAEAALLLIVLSVAAVAFAVAAIGEYRLRRSWDRADAACDAEDEARWNERRLNKAARQLVERNVARLASDLAWAERQERLTERERRERHQRRLAEVYMAFVEAGWLPPADSEWRPMAEARIARRSRARTQVAEVMA